VLTIVRLRDAEYVLRQIARGLEEYYTSSKEPPGVWTGQWCSELGLEGVVEADHLRALIRGADPTSGTELTTGTPPRKVNAFDATFSAPKSVSLLQALGTPEVALAVSICHTEALVTALGVLDRRAALTRRQMDGVRTVAGTGGLAIATFVHHTSRAADPQLHSHCVIPNLVRRDDLRYVALDASYLYEWAKAAGSIYQEELRRRLSEALGVAWGEDRNGCREMVGFADEQLCVFSKRTSEIEARLEANGSALAETPAEKRAMDDAAALATRAPKDPSLTPEVLAARWKAEAERLELPTGEALVERVCDRVEARAAPSQDVVFAHLLDPERGLCSRDSRFGEAQVTAAVAAVGGGTLDLKRIEELTVEFLASEHVVRLVPQPEPAGRRPPQWSLVSHRRREDGVLEALEVLANRIDHGVHRRFVDDATCGQDLGDDQRQAILALCSEGPALRALISPAGHGKTTTLAAAALVMRSVGRPVIGLSSTHQAVSELRRAGIDAYTVASVLRGRRQIPVTTSPVWILDETSQCSTADAEGLLQLVRSIPGAQLWCAGDSSQAQSVAAGGLAHEIERKARERAIPAPCLSMNRRQVDLTEREALSVFREGHVCHSQELRASAGLEHELADASTTKLAMAAACARDVLQLGANNVVGLCATHAEAEEIADAVRSHLKAAGVLRGPELRCVGWTTQRAYCIGDRILLHATTRTEGAELHNGDVVTITWVDRSGFAAITDDGRGLLLDSRFVTGFRKDGSPNVSHAWARTIEGAQGGTWEQVHLLGSPALDHQRGYVGQSRGRLPTHTWNARPGMQVDHGGHLVQTPTATEAVAEAMERDRSQRFAADEDPYRKDRLLRQEKEQLLSVLMNKRHADEERRLTKSDSWHETRVQQIDRELEYHWARAVLAAAREGNPLAFGADKLQAAQRTVEHELDRQGPAECSREGLKSDGPDQAKESNKRGWSDRDLIDLTFPARRDATSSAIEQVRAHARRKRANEDERRRNRSRSDAANRYRRRGFGR
jgi:conjugative relaxase-like TrwC/TraI family protein